MSLTDVLGSGYDSLIEAQVDKSPDELVVTKDDETYYIVSEDDVENTLAPAGYKVVVNIGE